MADGHFLLVYARDSFFEKGGAGDRRWSPACVAAGARMREGLGRGGGRSGDIKNGRWSEGKEVVSPLL